MNQKFSKNSQPHPELTGLAKKIDTGVRLAVAEALDRHRKLGQSIVIIRNGEIVTLTGDEIPVQNLDQFNIDDEG
jgi:hypothetical protein